MKDVFLWLMVEKERERGISIIDDMEGPVLFVEGEDKEFSVYFFQDVCCDSEVFIEEEIVDGVVIDFVV